LVVEMRVTVVVNCTGTVVVPFVTGTVTVMFETGTGDGGGGDG
jgi:hypothetical protein